MMEPPYLDVISPSGRRQVSLRQLPLTIGRGSTNRLPVEDLMASRQHCVLEACPQGVALRDLGSRNGTLMREGKVKHVLLRPGDVFAIGTTKFRFVDISKIDAPKPEPEPEPAQAREDHIPFAKLRKMARLGEPGSPSPNKLALIDARGQTVHSSDDLSDDSQTEENQSVTPQGVALLKLMLLAAMTTGASDIHMEPKAEQFIIRCRVDGIMVDAQQVPNDVGAKVYGSIKVLSHIDIAQRQTIQEGHFCAMLQPRRRVDYRVSFTPTMHGQKLVLRVLDLASAPQKPDELHLPPWMLQELRKTSRQSAGMILVCGPTGSGKTTTLYSILRDIDINQRNVITIEDPVEYQIEGVTQMPIDDKHGNSFHTMLRSVLRQDPDVLLLGEIRDPETASTAMQAATTGHLVLSTVHSKDTVGTIFRLLDLGVEPFLVASSLNLILAQRLIRLLCPSCKAAKKPTPTETKLVSTPGAEVGRIYYAVGCEKCFGTGYQGRQGLFELLVVNDALRDIILNKPTMADIRETLKRTVFVTLQDAGYQMVAKGLTSMDEVDRVVGGG